MIYNQRKGLAATGVDSQRIIAILRDIYNKAVDLSVTQAKSIEKQERIISNLNTYIDEVNSTYIIMEGR